jgi:hypothetical protein
MQVKKAKGKYRKDDLLSDTESNMVSKSRCCKLTVQIRAKSVPKNTKLD